MALDFPSSPTTNQLYTGPDGTVWKWDGTKWVSGVTAGVLSASQMDLGTRLAAAGTKLNALGPSADVYAPSVSPATALDNRVNLYVGSGNYEWQLPSAPNGGAGSQCLAITLSNGTNSCTIRPVNNDSLTAPNGLIFNTTTPLVIPGFAGGGYASLWLVSRISGGWDMLSVSPGIADVLGWVRRPYLWAAYGGATIGVAATWVKVTMDNVAQDSHGYWNAAGTCYQPKRAGRYRVTYDANVGANGGPGPSAVYVAISKNGGIVDQRAISWNGAAYLPYQTALSITTIISMNGIADYIEPYALVSGSATPVITGGNANVLTVDWLGP